MVLICNKKFVSLRVRALQCIFPSQKEKDRDIQNVEYLYPTRYHNKNDLIDYGRRTVAVDSCERNQVPGFQGKPNAGSNQRSKPIHPQTLHEKHRNNPNMPRMGLTLTVPARR